MIVQNSVRSDLNLDSKLPPCPNIKLWEHTGKKYKLYALCTSTLDQGQLSAAQFY